MDDDIWSGGSIKPSKKYADFHYDSNPWAVSKARSYSPDYGGAVIKIMCAIGIAIAFVASMFLPSLFHSSLVVCQGSSCQTYTDFAVVSENKRTGILEVYAGGRLMRLSNGTWHYE